MNTQDTVVVLPAIIGAIIFGLKRAIPKALYAKVHNYVPIFAIGLGVLISIIYSAVYNLTATETFITITQGVVVGAAAVGYREAAKRTIKKDDIIQ